MDINIWEQIKQSMIKKSKKWEKVKSHKESPKEYLPYRISVKDGNEVNIVKGEGKSIPVEEFAIENPQEIIPLHRKFL